LTICPKSITLTHVENLHKKPIIGILGGIGSGKSTVAAEFAKLGCAVIDADKIAHNLLDKPPIQEKIFSVFGKNISNNQGKIDRAKLANSAFSDSDKLKQLTDILHPPVINEVERQVQQYQRDTATKAVVLDIPLLMETGWDKHCDRLIFVKCDQNNRFKRALKSGFADIEQIKIRENFQISLDKKRIIAENTIDNNSDLSALSRQVADIFPCIIS